MKITLRDPPPSLFALSPSPSLSRSSSSISPQNAFRYASQGSSGPHQGRRVQGAGPERGQAQERPARPVCASRRCVPVILPLCETRSNQHFTDAQSPPELFFAGLDSSKTYLIVSLDIDAPFPSFDILGPILHWIQPGVKISESGTLDTTAPFVADYIGPAPPPGSSPHRYIFFLYEEPAGFDAKAHAPPNGKKLGAMSRMRYDFDAWAKKINLGSILAFSYFNSN